eukprot:4448858-Amphidinium_carterae.1
MRCKCCCRTVSSSRELGRRVFARAAQYFDRTFNTCHIRSRHGSNIGGSPVTTSVQQARGRQNISNETNAQLSVQLEGDLKQK